MSPDETTRTQAGIIAFGYDVSHKQEDRSAILSSSNTFTMVGRELNTAGVSSYPRSCGTTDRDARICNFATPVFIHQVGDTHRSRS